MSVNLTLIETGLTQAQTRVQLMARSFEVAPRRLARRGAEILRSELKRFAPVKTGKLREELNFTLSGRNVARFYGPFYTKWVIAGRGPITKLDGFLHFWVDGHEIFTHHVKAARANDFRRPALITASPRIEALMHEAGVRTMRGEIGI